MSDYRNLYPELHTTDLMELQHHGFELFEHFVHFRELFLNTRFTIL